MQTCPVKARDVLMRSVRAFFYARGYTEVETPVRLETPCMELHIDAEPSGDHFLRTSPEIFHKQLLAAGHTRIFEIGKCFRSGERGPLHHPEYTMLEWYQTDADYMDILEETRDLVSRVWNAVSNDWKILTVSDAFREFAGWDPAGNYDEDRFDIDLVDRVEPAIRAMGGPVVLKDYPVEAAALSRVKPDDPRLAERWELYIDGVEIANAYSELTDPVEQRARFEACAAQRQAMGKTVYPIDENFIQALEKMPASGGIALGVDRLLMLMQGETSLDAVLPFRS
ncbi:EF-P lysine aminoacylase EpmA [Pontiella sp.]|uniref:EF-P lysine aminoacylase EpmA n=1 Tax=Pontiella sp. TaxID=2837462 RepID=UPI00356AF6BD